MRTLRLLLCSLALPALAGCTPNLFVKDENGKPVEGAEVWGIGSVSKRLATTGSDGSARVSVWPSATVVRKPGYQEYWLKPTDPEPYHLTLRRVGR